MESIFIPTSPRVIVDILQQKRKIPHNRHHRLNRKFGLIKSEREHKDVMCRSRKLA